MWKTDRDGRILNVPEDIWGHSMDAGRYAIVSIVPIKRRPEYDPYAFERWTEKKPVNPAR